MTRVAKKPQYKEYNHRLNCYGNYQEHTKNLREWRNSRRSLMLELGAGTAAISLAFMEIQPDWQVLAVDRKSDRLNKAARQLEDQFVDQLAFLQADIKALEEYLPLRDEVNLLWLAFPDPYPTQRQAKHRLTHPHYLKLYRLWLKPQALIRFKTDSQALFDYTKEIYAASSWLEITDESSDLSEDNYQLEDVLTQTNYENRFRASNLPIYYLEAQKQ